MRHLFWHARADQPVAMARDVVSAAGPATCSPGRSTPPTASPVSSAGTASPPPPSTPNRSQSQRERALADFVTGKVTALVATDVAARGIHVDNVGVVVHYDPPATGKDYVHRSGRTGRAGADGIVVTFVGPDKVRDVYALQRSLALRPQVATMAMEDLGRARGVAAVSHRDGGDGHPASRDAGPPATPCRHGSCRARSRVACLTQSSPGGAT